MDKMKMHTVDITDSNIEKIGQLFPSCLTERVGEDGRVEKVIDFDQLRQELSKEIVEGPQERYQFTWPNKKKAIRQANTPSTFTLRPVRHDEKKASGFDSNGVAYCSSGSVDFDKTENLYIEGDNLEVLKLLREDYLGKVKMIYIDPPYNTGKDLFVYNDDFVIDKDSYIHDSGQYDSAGNKLISNTESNGRFHTDWLNMVYPRIRVSKDLLSEDGVIFISIDDNEVDNLRKICDEVFGESNFVANLIWKSKSGGANDSKYIAVDHEYILVFAKNINFFSTNLVGYTEELENLYTGKDDYYNERGPYRPMLLQQKGLSYSESLTYPITAPDGSILVPESGGAIWRWSKQKFEEGLRNGFIEFKKVNGEYKVYTKQYLNVDYDGNPISRGKLLRSVIDDVDGRLGTRFLQTIFNEKVFTNSKPVELIKLFIQIATEADSIIMDFFSGSATTAQSVMEYNNEHGGCRRFIMIQLPEKTDQKSDAFKAGYKNICEIGKERIRRAGKKILEGHSAAKEQGGLFEQEDSKLKVDVGFRVLKLDTSNMQDVYYRPEESSESTLFEDNIKPDRTPEDLLFQVMLECNLPLSSKIENKKIAGKDVFSVNDGYLIACFDTDVNEDLIKAVAKMKPYYFILRDSSLSSDNVADNFDQIFQAYSKETIRRVL